MDDDDEDGDGGCVKHSVLRAGFEHIVTHTENAMIILAKLFKHFIPFAFNLIAKSFHHYDPAINHNRRKMSVDYSNG